MNLTCGEHSFDLDILSRDNLHLTFAPTKKGIGWNLRHEDGRPVSFGLIGLADEV